MAGDASVIIKDRSGYVHNYYLKNKEKINARSNERYQQYAKYQVHDRYILNKDKKREYNRKYFINNKLKMSVVAKKWRLENKKVHTEYQKKYHNIYKNTERGKFLMKAQMHSRRARLKGLTVATVQQVYQENIIKFGTLTCELCFKPVIFGQDSLEHFHPISRANEYDGDINERKNLGVAHKSCNNRKSKKTLEEYLKGVK